MYYTEEQKREVELQNLIKEYKDKIKELLNKFYTKEIELGLLNEEEIDESKKLYGHVIGRLNECFFEFNITDMMSHLRSEGFSIPHNDIINLMNSEELDFYKSMLSKVYKELKGNKTINPEICMATATSIGNRAKEFYELKHKNTPLNVLKNRLTEEKQKQELENLKLKKIKDDIKELKEYKKQVKELTKENINLRKMMKLERK